jgi:release factor glutamine methyltransferase
VCAATAEAEVALRLRAAGCVFAEDEARLIVAAAESPDALDDLVRRRCAGEPLEHILGWAEFCGIRVAVDPGVFVPRRRSELLVRQASSLVAPGAVVVDVCCGSGAVGAAVADGGGPIELYAVDVDPAAARCAQANIVAFGGRAFAGDLFDPLPASLRGRVDVVVANAPYVPTDELRLMPPEARDHEPRVALDGGQDGLDVQRRVVAGALNWLAPAGWLLVESSRRQATLTVEAFETRGLDATVVVDAEIGGTVVIGSRSG